MSIIPLPPTLRTEPQVTKIVIKKFTDVIARAILASFENENPTDEEKQYVLDAWKSVDFSGEEDKPVYGDVDVKMFIVYVYMTPSARKIITDDESKYLINDIKFTDNE